MASKKSTKRRKNPAISRAPPPPPKLPSGGYDQIKSKRPDWNFWNKLPALLITECIMLLIDVEPGTYLDRSKKQQYDRVHRLVQSFQAIGVFPSAYSDIAPSKFIAWAKSAGEEPPKEWQPKSCGPDDDNAHMAAQIEKQAKNTVHWKRRRELLEAAEKRLESGELTVKPTIKELLHYMRDGEYPNCNNTTYKAIQKSIERTGGNPFDDLSYRAAVDRHAADKTDKQ